jgi:hypothetical protein
MSHLAMSALIVLVVLTFIAGVVGSFVLFEVLDTTEALKRGADSARSDR